MRLTPLYRARFTYADGWNVGLAESALSQHLFVAQGTCEGRVNGSLRGMNHPMRRPDGTFVADFQGVIETGDGGVILFDLRGYDRAYPVGSRQIVGAITHVSDHPRYLWLNDVVCVAAGEVRVTGEGVEMVIETAELVWEPLVDVPDGTP